MPITEFPKVASIKDFVEFIGRIIIRQNKKRLEVNDRIATKWNEIEKTHVFFTQSIRDIINLSKVALERLDHTDDIIDVVKQMQRELELVNSRREESRHSRMSQYEEARAYLDFDWSERHSLLKSVPDDMSYLIQNFMIEYCFYFSGETSALNGLYSHELFHVISNALNNIEKFRNNGLQSRDLRNYRDNIRNDKIAGIEIIVKSSERALVELDSRWSRVAYAFAKLKLHALHYTSFGFDQITKSQSPKE